ncbi:MAG TPA: O-antigen ligase family protein [Candidatus Acidoferrales bacterium]|nr:O-antigen ligase family protein [Candidatus Acidoferrales bacterium]
MGFFLTIAYIVATLLSPEQFGPAAAGYHPLLLLGAITLAASLPGLFSGAPPVHSVQALLLGAFFLAITLSGIHRGWLGGIFLSWQEFLPSAAVFFFIVANAASLQRLKILTAALVCAAVVLAVEALCGYYRGYGGDLFVLQQNVPSGDGGIAHLARVRGAGFLNDPNDFAQMLLIALPLLFLAWRERRAARNFFLVLAPAAALLWALYLTHSRGALIALAALALFALRPKIGTAASVMLIAALFASLLGLEFTVGRGISAADGAGRLEAWASGLEMFKSAPLLGVGFGRFTDLNDLTAHNSFVLCLAELGLIGSTLWMALLVTTLMGLTACIRAAREALDSEDEPNEMPATEKAGEAGGNNFASAAPADCREPSSSLRLPGRWAVALRMSLVAFITTGWFLSRSYRAPLYLVLGLATAAMALAPSPAEDRAPRRWIVFTLAAEAWAILCVYGMVRL